jgi:ABC-type transporter MlaC component
MGEVIQVNCGASGQSEGFADERAAELIEPLRADFDSAGLSEEWRAQYRSIARDLMDQIAHRHCAASLSLPIPGCWRASQAEIDAITAAFTESMEALYLNPSPQRPSSQIGG